nr:TrkA family potassium uptake protein [uncultured Caproiciproducens sp.]
MNILIVGGHENAHYLIKSFKQKGHEVMIVNPDHDWCQMLADTYEIEAICGNGTDAGTLKQAHAEKMDVIIALEKQDAANLIISELAKKQFHVQRTFAIVNDPKNVELFQGLGVDRCVNTTRIFNELVEQQAMKENIRKYLPMENGRIVICEVQLTDKSPALHKKLWEIGFPSQSTVAYILRGEEIIVPQGNTELMAGDMAIVLSSSQSMESTITMLNGKTKH